MMADKGTDQPEELHARRISARRISARDLASLLRKPRAEYCIARARTLAYSLLHRAHRGTSEMSISRGCLPQALPPSLTLTMLLDPFSRQAML